MSLLKKIVSKIALKLIINCNNIVLSTFNVAVCTFQQNWDPKSASRFGSFQFQSLPIWGLRQSGEGVKGERWKSVTWGEGVKSFDFLVGIFFEWPLSSIPNNFCVMLQLKTVFRLRQFSAFTGHTSAFTGQTFETSTKEFFRYTAGPHAGFLHK